MIISGVAFIFMCMRKETYAPALLRKKAKLRRKEQDDDRYWSRYDNKIKFWPLLKVNLSRPFVMVFTEPIWSAPHWRLIVEGLSLIAPQYVLGCIHSDHLRHSISLLRCLSHNFQSCPRMVHRSNRTGIYRPSCRYVHLRAASSDAKRLFGLHDIFRERRAFRTPPYCLIARAFPSRKTDPKVSTGCFLVISTEKLLRRMIDSHVKDPETGKVPPEAMVSVVCIAAVLAPVGQLWFPWTCVPPVHWVWPILAGIPFGAGNTAIFIYASNYLAHSYGSKIHLLP